MSISSLTECFLHLLYLSESPPLAPSDASPPTVYAHALNAGPHGRIGALPFCRCFHWTLLFLPQVPCLEPHVICLSDSFYLPEVCYEFLKDFDAQISHSPTLLLSYLLMISIYMSVILPLPCPLNSLKHFLQCMLSFPWFHFYSIVFASLISNILVSLLHPSFFSLF